MRKVLIIAGIIILVACVLILAYAALNWYGYRHVLDGTPSLYDRLHRRAIIYSVSGGVTAVAGTVCLIVQSKM